MLSGADRDIGAAAPGEQAEERRTPILCGERACVGCSFNLSGQQVVREGHYGLLIVRCPECGAVASLQEYPALGRWTGRWAAMAAGLYLLVLLGALFASSGVGFAVCMASADGPVDAAADAIAKIQDADIGADPARSARPGGPSMWDRVSPEWLAKQDERALIARAAPWRTAVLPEALPFWLTGAVAAFCFGVAMAATLLGVSRSRLAFATLGPALLCAFFCWQRWLEIRAGVRLEVRELAERLLGPTIWGATIGVLMLAMAAGLLLGRPIARGLVKALLPPRLSGALSLLWTCDGLRWRPKARRAARARD